MSSPGTFHAGCGSAQELLLTLRMKSLPELSGSEGGWVVWLCRMFSMRKQLVTFKHVSEKSQAGFPQLGGILLICVAPGGVHMRRC